MLAYCSKLCFSIECNLEARGLAKGQLLAYVQVLVLHSVLVYSNSRSKRQKIYLTFNRATDFLPSFFTRQKSGLHLPRTFHFSAQSSLAQALIDPFIRYNLYQRLYCTIFHTFLQPSLTQASIDPFISYR